MNLIMIIDTTSTVSIWRRKNVFSKWVKVAAKFKKGESIWTWVREYKDIYGLPDKHIFVDTDPHGMKSKRTLPPFR